MQGCVGRKLFSFNITGWLKHTYGTSHFISDVLEAFRKESGVVATPGMSESQEFDHCQN